MSSDNHFFSIVLFMILQFMAFASTYVLSTWRTLTKEYGSTESRIAIGAIGVVSCIVIAKYFEKAAFFRGREGKAPPERQLRIMKVLFLSTCVGLPLLTVVESAFGVERTSATWIVLYAAFAYYASFHFSTVDEQRGGTLPESSLYTKRLSVWHWFVRRFNLTIEKTVDLDPTKTYILGNHPHAILPFGSMVALGAQSRPNDSFVGFDKLFPGFQYRALAASFCFYIPGYRELCLYGGVCDAARYSARHILNHGKSVMLVPGGATEALYCSSNEDVVYLKKRFGFIKLALEHGADLVPIFSFNECNCWSVLDTDVKEGDGFVRRTFSRIANAMKHRFQRITGLSLPIVLNVLPMKSNITVVVGKPIPVRRVRQPSKKQVAKLLDQYVESLKELHETHRARLSPGKPKLRVI